MSTSVFFAVVAFIYAAIEFFSRTRRDIPIVCMINEFLFIISWISCLAANKTFVSGNYGINLVWGIGKGGFYLVINLFTLRNVEVLLVIDKIKPKHDRMLVIVKFFMTYVIAILSIPLETLAITLPIAFPNEFPMVNTILYVQFAIGVSTPPLNWIYLYKLKRNIAKLKTSRKVYDVVEQKLEKILKRAIFQWTIVMALMLLMLYVPVLHENMGIPYCVITFIMHGSTVRYLRATKADQVTQNGESIKMINSPSSQQFGRNILDESENNQHIPLDNSNLSPATPPRLTVISKHDLDSRLSRENILESENLERHNENTEEGISQGNTLDDEQNDQFDVI